MDEKLKQNLKKQFDSLPVELQKAITSADISSKLQEIVKNNKLMIDQAGNVEMETRLVLLGLQPLENYVENLEKRVGLSSAQASTIAHDVNEKIFKNIREILRNINDAILGKEVGVDNTNNPSKEEILDGIENPEKIENNKIVDSEMSNLPEIAPVPGLPAISSLMSKSMEPYHQNISPVNNIVESKLNETIVMPKQNIVIEEKTKLPEKPRLSTDPYRESII